MRILFIEDNHTTRVAITAVLRRHGHEVVAANTGDEGWELFCRPGAPRLVLLDWMLPGLDGLELCRRMRARAQEFQPYIIMLTMKTGHEDVVQGLDAGADDYVVKPCNADELRARIGVGERVLAMQESLAAKAISLRETQEYLQNLIHYANAPIIVWNPQFQITEFNRAFEQLTGRDKAEVLGKHLDILFPPEQKNRAMTQIRKTLSGEHWETVEIPILDVQGDVHTVLWNSATLFAPNGITPVATIAQGHDITKRKQAQQQLVSANKRLEALWNVSSLSNANLRTVSDHILRTLTEMTESAYGFYGFVSDDESEMIIHAWSGEAMHDCAMVDKPTHFSIHSAGVWAEAVRQRQPFIMNHYEHVHDAKKGLPDGHVMLTNLLVVPFFSGDKITALAAVANRPYDYTQEDVQQIASFLQSVQAIQDSKRAEEALRESEERFRTLVEEAPEAIFMQMAGCFAYMNRAARCLYGVSETDTLIGAPVLDSFHPDYRAGVAERIHTLNEKQQQVPMVQEAILRMDGARVEVEVSAVPFSYHGDQGALVFLRDISEKKLAEEALRESERKYRELVEHANSIILRMNSKGDVLFFNEYAQSFFGYCPEEILGRNVVGTIVPETDSSGRDLAEMIRDIWVHPLQYVYNENENQRRNGERVWIAWTNKQVTDADGNPTELLCIGTDITQRVLAEQALRTSLQTSDDLVRAIPSGLFIYQYEASDRLILISANPEAERLTGIRTEAWRGREFDEIWPEARRIGITETYLNVARTGASFETESLSYKDDRLSGIFRIRVFILPEQRLGVAFEDITERRALENQLMQSQKMESVGRLAGGVAHDFNNMLQVILVHSEMALDQVDAANPLHENLQEIQQAAKRSADLTRQLLAFARRQAVTPKVLDLNTTIDGMLKMLRRLIGEDIDLAWLPESGLWSVKMDPAQVDQILANLCVNARDAIAGVGKISIQTANVSLDASSHLQFADAQPGAYVLLAVSDTGCGMNQETLTHIFEPFYTTKGQGEGTGLGLATVYGIVKQNDGYISVSSEEGKGTSFKIYLPRYSHEGEMPAEELMETPLRGGSETLLLVEDDLSILKLGRMTLEKLGYRVYAAASPREALTLAEQHRNELQLVITDVIMPEMNGRDLTEQIAAHCPGIKRLYMSGYTADVIAHHGVLEPGVEFIAKPFSTRLLAEKVRTVLDR